MSELTFKDALADSFGMVRGKAKQAKQTIKGLIGFYQNRISLEDTIIKSYAKNVLEDFPSELTSFRVALTATSACMQQTSDAHKPYRDLLKTEVLPKLTSLLHDLRQVKAKLEHVEKTSRKQYLQRTDDVTKAKKKGLQSAVDQAVQALSIAESEHSKTMAGIMAMFEKNERTRLNTLREIFIKSGEAEKTVMASVTDANFTVESCYLATNVEADLTELIMDLHKQKMQEKYLEEAEAAAKIEEDERIDYDYSQYDETTPAPVEKEEKPKARIPIEISEDDLKHIAYSQLHTFLPTIESLTPCSLKGWNLKSSNINIISYVALIISYDYKIPTDKSDLFTKLASVCNIDDKLQQSVITHPIDTHANLTATLLIDLISKYSFKDFANDTVNYRIWLRTHLSLLFTSLLWYIKQSEETEDVKSKQLLTIRKHGKEVQILLSDESPEDSDISWCLELLPPILSDCKEILSLFPSVVSLPIPVTNALFENILFTALQSDDLKNEFKQIVGLLDVFSTVLDINDHFSFTGIFHTLLQTYTTTHPRNFDLYMKIEDITEKIKELGKDVLDPSVLDKPDLFIYPLSNDAIIAITRESIRSIVTKGINALVDDLQSFYLNYLNDTMSIKPDLKLYKLLYSIQQIYSDNADPFQNIDEITSQSLLDITNTGIDNIFSELSVDEEKAPLELPAVILKVLELIKSPQLNVLLGEMKTIREDIDTYAYGVLRTMTKDHVKNKCDDLIQSTTIDYEILALYNATCDFDKNISDVLQETSSIHTTLATYINQWISNSFSILTSQIETSLKNERWKSDIGETEKLNPSDSAQKLVLSIKTMLNSIISNLGGEPLPETCTKLFVKQVVDILQKYCNVVLRDNDNIATVFPAIPPPPVVAKSSGWGLKNLLGNKRRTTETIATLIYDIDSLCVRINTLNFIKMNIQPFYDLIFEVLSSDEESSSSLQKAFEQFNNQFLEYETKILKYVGYYVVFVGLRSQILDSLYNPTFETNTLQVILSNNINVLTHPFDVIEPVYHMHIRVNLLDAVISAYSRVLCNSGRAMTRATVNWEFTYKGTDTAETYPAEIAEKIEEALGNGAPTLKCVYNSDSLFFDLCAMTVTNVKTDLVGTFHMKYQSQINDDVNFFKQFFAEQPDTGDVNLLCGIDLHTIDVHLEAIDSVLRYSHSSSNMLIHELEGCEESRKEQIISLLKHRIDDPIAVKGVAGK